MKKVVFLSLLLPSLVMAQGWKENFKQVKPKTYSVSNNATMQSDGNSILFKRTKGGMQSFSRYITYDFNGRNRYLQMNFVSVSGNCMLSSNIGGFQTWFRPRAGLFTFPAFDSARPDLNKKPMKGQMAFRCYFNTLIHINEFAFVDNNAPCGIFISIIGPDGKVKDSRKPAVAGDTVRIDMPVKDKPDNLSLYLYQINHTNNWAYKGRFEALTLPGVPLELKESSTPLRYRAEFKLQKLQKPLKLAGSTFVAAVNYLAGDSNNRGVFYGVCANPFDIAGGGKQMAGTSTSSLQVYDFGPPNGAVASDSIMINNKAGHKTFRFRGCSASFSTGYRKALDPLLMDCMLVNRNRAANMEIKVPKGKIKVTIGLGALGNSYCWIQGFSRPLNGKILINGKETWNFKEGKAECFALASHIARKNENLFKIYMEPHIKTLVKEVDCPNGILKVSVRAGNKNVPVNFLAIHKAGDKQAEGKLKRMIDARYQAFNEFWADSTPSENELNNSISAKNYRKKNQDYAVFARNNPYEYIFYDTHPLVTELNQPLRILAAPGQYGVGTVLLRTFKDVKNMTAQLQLKGFEKASVSFIIPYRFAGFSVRKHFVAPNHYMPVGTRNFDANTSYGFRICFKTPANMKKGTYKGSLEFKGNKITTRFPIEIRVTGEKLPELNDHVIAMLGMSGRGELLYNGMLFCKEELGCNTAAFMFGWPRLSKFVTDKNGAPIDVVRDKKYLREWFETYKKVGFPGKTPFMSLQSAPSRLDHYKHGPYKLHSKHYVKAAHLQYGQLCDMAIKYGGCTGIIADLGGEMGHGSFFPKQQVMDAAKEVFKIVSKIPNVKASYRCNCSETTKQFYDHLQVQGVRDPGSWPVSDRQSNFGKNKHLYTYSVEGRFANGLHSWAHGARGNLREWLIFRHQVEYNDFNSCCGLCGGTFHFEAMPGPNNNYIPTVRSDAFRASVIDRQYLRMLDNAIASSKYPRIKKKAEAFRSILKDRADAWKEPQGIPWMSANNPWPGIRLDLMREAIVILCQELKTGKEILGDFVAVPRKIGKGIAPAPVEKDIMKAPESRKGFTFNHWRSIRTGECWEKQGLPYDGCAWYRKTIRIPKGFATPVLRIGSADEQAWVFCNGKFVKYHNGWNKPFEVELKNVKADDMAEIAIYVYDSMNMGGIWRSVSLHKNLADAKANKNGVNCDANWKIALDPRGRKLDIFEFTEGPLVGADVNKVEAKVMLVPQNDTGLRKLASAESYIEIRSVKGKVLRRMKLGKIMPYGVSKFVIDLTNIREKAADAVLVTDGMDFAKMRFYRITRWRP